MFNLILHHDYKDGEIKDISGCGNHARFCTPSAVDGRRPSEKAFYFNGTNDRIVVVPSKSLSDLQGIRATAWIWVEEAGQRRNIMEGFLSFAFHIDAEASLLAGMYDGVRWYGIRSSPGAVPIQEWVEVRYIYDGIDTSLLYVNERLVGERYGYTGNIQGIQWPFGFSIGAWPDADKYIFKGKIAEIKLWGATDQID
jgi:hypothetical protein